MRVASCSCCPSLHSGPLKIAGWGGQFDHAATGVSATNGWPGLGSTHRKTRFGVHCLAVYSESPARQCTPNLQAEIGEPLNVHQAPLIGIVKFNNLSVGKHSDITQHVKANVAWQGLNFLNHICLLAEASCVCVGTCTHVSCECGASVLKYMRDAVNAIWFQPMSRTLRCSNCVPSATVPSTRGLRRDGSGKKTSAIGVCATSHDTRCTPSTLYP